jgi:chemotaxis protein MotB
VSRHRRREAEEHENHERWLITYADMITLLMAFFIMMYAMSVVDLKKFEALSSAARHVFGGDAEEAGETGRDGGATASGGGLLSGASELAVNRASLVNEMNRALNAALPEQLREHVAITHSGARVIVSVRADRITFPVGAAELTPEVRQILDAIGPALRGTHARVLIEGHTCNLPIRTARYPSNWELSAQRAANVMVHLVRQSRLDPDLISASGYADTQPVAPNETKDGRRRNRRVDIVVLGDEGTEAPGGGSAQRPSAAGTGIATGLLPRIDLRERHYQQTGRHGVDLPGGL